MSVEIARGEGVPQRENVVENPHRLPCRAGSTSIPAGWASGRGGSEGLGHRGEGHARPLWRAAHHRRQGHHPDLSRRCRDIAHRRPAPPRFRCGRHPPIGLRRPVQRQHHRAPLMDRDHSEPRQGCRARLPVRFRRSGDADKRCGPGLSRCAGHALQHRQREGAVRPRPTRLQQQHPVHRTGPVRRLRSGAELRLRRGEARQGLERRHRNLRRQRQYRYRQRGLGLDEPGDLRADQR